MICRSCGIRRVSVFAPASALCAPCKYAHAQGARARLSASQPAPAQGARVRESSSPWVRRAESGTLPPKSFDRFAGRGGDV